MEESIPYDIYAEGTPGVYQMYGLPSTPLMNHQQQHSQSFELNASDGYNQPYPYIAPQYAYAQTHFVPAAPTPTPTITPAAPEAHTGQGRPELFRTPSDENQAQVRSSSEEKDASAPAAKRRKEQNRAAQRAFRERKERHVKDLEQRLAAVQKDFTTSQSDNERLKRELAKVATERDILRATSSPNHPLSSFSDSLPAPDEEPTHTGPMQFVPTDSHTFVKSKDYQAKQRPGKVSRPHRMAINPATGMRLFTAGETWDYIQRHELYEKGLIDIGDVCEMLKTFAKCGGQGPTFEEADIKRAIEKSVVSPQNGLL